MKLKRENGGGRRLRLIALSNGLKWWQVARHGGIGTGIGFRVCVPLLKERKNR